MYVDSAVWRESAMTHDEFNESENGSPVGCDGYFGGDFLDGESDSEEDAEASIPGPLLTEFADTPHEPGEGSKTMRERRARMDASKAAHSALQAACERAGVRYASAA